MDHDIPWRVQCDATTNARDILSPRLCTRSQHGLRLAGFEIGRAHKMVLGICDVEDVLIEEGPLRMMKLGFVEFPVAAALAAAADHIEDPPFRSSDQNPVVIRIADEQTPSLLVRRDLTRIGEQRLGPRGCFQCHFYRRADQGFLLEKVGNAGSQYSIHRIEDTFARHRADDLTVGIDQDESRPCPSAKAVPYAEIGVIDDGMLDSVPDHCFANLAGLFLIAKLGGMDTDDYEFLRILLLELLQLGNYMHAVDAAECPEIQQYKLPAEVPKFDRRRGIEPGEPVRKLRGGGGSLQQLRIILRVSDAGSGKCKQACQQAAPAQTVRFSGHGHASIIVHQEVECPSMLSLAG